MVANQIERAVGQSVNDQNPDNMGGMMADLSLFLGLVGRVHNFISPWGTYKRQFQLRRIFYDYHNTLVQGVITNLIQQVVQTPTELSGGPRLTYRWNDLFQWAQYGAGWDDFLSPVLQDYLTLDVGAFVEIIGPGAPDTPLSQQVSGVAHLDALRCYATGNPEFPVYFRSHVTGQMHKLHWTRVHRLVDLPSPDPAMRGMGFSALSRALAVVQAQQLMSTYNVESLDDLPPKGIVTITGVGDTQFKQAIQQYEADRMMDGQRVFRNLLQLTGIKPDAEVKVGLTPFATVPESFNYQMYMQIHVNLVALSIGVDPQDVWPLTGQALGTGTQSKILHQKGKGKSYGAMLKILTRTFNIAVLPKSLELKFKPKDTEQDKESADTAKAWSDVVGDLLQKGVLNQMTALQILANTVPEYADVLRDDAGNVRLVDDDAQPEETAVEDIESTGTEQPESETAVDDTETPTAQRSKDLAFKDLSSLQTDWEADFKDFLTTANNGDMARRRAGVVLRALINRFGNAAFREGLREGGVDPEDIGASDLGRIQELTIEQSPYVTRMLSVVYDSGLSPDQIAQKSGMWFNGSVRPFYTAGLMSADRNGYYEWELGSTEKHCDDCPRLDGQIHRLKDWMARNLIAGTVGQDTKCQGYNCDCKQHKRRGVRARGRY